MWSCTGNSHLLPRVISLASPWILHLLGVQRCRVTLQCLLWEVSGDCSFPFHSDSLKQTHKGLLEESRSSYWEWKQRYSLTLRMFLSFSWKENWTLEIWDWKRRIWEQKWGTWVQKVGFEAPKENLWCKRGVWIQKKKIVSKNTEFGAKKGEIPRNRTVRYSEVACNFFARIFFPLYIDLSRTCSVFYWSEACKTLCLFCSLGRKKQEFFQERWKDLASGTLNYCLQKPLLYPL